MANYKLLFNHINLRFEIGFEKLYKFVKILRLGKNSINYKASLSQSDLDILLIINKSMRLIFYLYIWNHYIIITMGNTN